MCVLVYVSERKGMRVCLCTCVCMCVCRERERKRERKGEKRERELQCVAVNLDRLQWVIACCGMRCIVMGAAELSDVAVCCNALNLVASEANNLVPETDICLSVPWWI